MSIIGLYGWILPGKGELLARYRDNDALYNSAVSLWNSVEDSSFVFLIIAVVTGVLFSCLYYYLYNIFPGRKYRLRHWFIWLAMAAAISFALTLGAGYGLVQSNLQEKSSFLMKISFVNAMYSVIIYFVTSFISCNIPLKTNAFRFLKIGR